MTSPLPPSLPVRRLSTRRYPTLPKGAFSDPPSTQEAPSPNEPLQIQREFKETIGDYVLSTSCDALVIVFDYRDTLVQLPIHLLHLHHDPHSRYHIELGNSILQLWTMQP
jgi:hypothetical protein